jgi:hypothetical protein
MATTKRLTKEQVGRKYGFRSGLEETNAKGLEALGVPFTYEEERIEYTKPARKARYTPDFIVRENVDGTPRKKPLIIETKGRFLTADRQKHLMIKDQYPELDIRFVFNNPNARISKQSKTTYAMWCEKHGFQYAKGMIPAEWLQE